MSALKVNAGFLNQKNGMSFERKVHRRIKDDRGLFTLHAEGSRGLFDIISMTPEGKLRCIIVKNNGYMTPREENTIHQFLLQAPDYVQVELHFKQSPRKSGCIQLTL